MRTAVSDRNREERDEALGAAVAIAESETFNPDDELYKSLRTRAEQIDGRISELAALMEARKNSDALDGRIAKTESRSSTATWQVNEQPLSFGEQFVRSQAYLDYAGSPRGRMPKIEMETRALPGGLSDFFGSGKLSQGSTTVDVQAPAAPTPLLDNISRIQVSSNAVDYVSWSTTSGGAAVVPEKSPKPSIEFAPSVTSDSLDNIAVYTQLTRQLIEDAPAVRDKINNELLREIVRKEEEEVASAIGSASLATADGEDVLAAIRKGVGVVQTAGYAPNAVLLHPSDWADLDLAVMGGTLNGPVVRANFWGLTPIPSPVQSEGTAIVGDFRTAVTQFYRSAIDLYITDSHGETFLSNVFTLLAERRSLAAVIRPQALVEVGADGSV